MKLVKVSSGIMINADEIVAIIRDPKQLKTIIVMSNGIPVVSCLDYNGTIGGIVERLKDNETDVMVFGETPEEPSSDVKNVAKKSVKK